LTILQIKLLKVTDKYVFVLLKFLVNLVIIKTRYSDNNDDVSKKYLSFLYSK